MPDNEQAEARAEVLRMILSAAVQAAHRLRDAARECGASSIQDEIPLDVNGMDWQLTVSYLAEFDTIAISAEYQPQPDEFNFNDFMRRLMGQENQEMSLSYLVPAPWLPDKWEGD